MLGMGYCTTANFPLLPGAFSGTYDQFKEFLKKIWFGLYDRDGTAKTVLDSR